MFKKGYWYKYTGKQSGFNNEFYNNVINWRKCISITSTFVIFEPYDSWFISNYKYFEESKFNPDIKRKLRRILDV